MLNQPIGEEDMAIQGDFFNSLVRFGQHDLLAFGAYMSHSAETQTHYPPLSTMFDISLEEFSFRDYHIGLKLVLCFTLSFKS